MAFVVALTILLCVLVASLLVTNSHLLARVLRLEREVEILRLAPSPAADAVDPQLAHVDHDVVVVSASCASCAVVLDRLCAQPTNGTVIVVGSEGDAALIAGECAAPVIVSPITVQYVRRAGFQLPVIVRMSEGRVDEIVPAAATEDTRR